MTRPTVMVVLVVAGAISTAAQGAPPRFEATSVKRNTSGAVQRQISPRPAGLEAINVSVKDLLRFVFRAQDFQLADLPDWMVTDRFDVRATTGGAPLTLDQLHAAVRALLTERFRLTVTQARRDLDGYELVARRDGQMGPQLRRTTSDCAARRTAPPTAATSSGAPCATRIGSNSFSGLGVPIARLAERLSTVLSAPVADKTGLEGEYDITLQYSAVTPRVDDPDDRPALFTALQEQLGLKLSRAQVPVDVLIVRASAPADLD